MKLSIRHLTHFTYHEPARDSVNEVRLSPLATPTQRRESFVMKVIPASPLMRYHDLRGNVVHRFEIPKPHGRLVIDTRSVVSINDRINYDDLPFGTRDVDLPGLRACEHCCEFLEDSRYVQVSPEIWREAIDIKNEVKDVFQTAYALMEFINRECRYVAGVTDASTSAQEVFERKEGVCQDYAHLLVAYCRSIGIPARYVSGYLWDPGVEGLRGAQASHAWVDVYLPGKGWVGLDPTNNKIVNEQYVVVANGRDYADVAPVRGTFYGGGHHHGLEVQVEVKKVGGGDEG